MNESMSGLVYFKPKMIYSINDCSFTVIKSLLLFCCGWQHTAYHDHQNTDLLKKKHFYQDTY